MSSKPASLVIQKLSKLSTAATTTNNSGRKAAIITYNNYNTRDTISQDDILTEEGVLIGSWRTPTSSPFKSCLSAPGSPLRTATGSLSGPSSIGGSATEFKNLTTLPQKRWESNDNVKINQADIGSLQEEASKENWSQLTVLPNKRWEANDSIKSPLESLIVSKK